MDCTLKHPHAASVSGTILAARREIQAVLEQSGKQKKIIKSTIRQAIDRGAITSAEGETIQSLIIGAISVVRGKRTARFAINEARDQYARLVGNPSSSPAAVALAEVALTAITEVALNEAGERHPDGQVVAYASYTAQTTGEKAIIGALAGAVIGFDMGGPVGAVIGAAVGAAVGACADEVTVTGPDPE